MFDLYSRLAHELPRLHLTDAVDVLLVAVLVWVGFTYLRQTRSRLALLGILFLGGIYLAARQLDLQLTVWILQGFFAVVVLVLVVVFQDDLRRLFERIAVLGLRRRATELPDDAVDALVRTVSRQAKAKVGALYVLPGRESLEPHLEGGIELDGRLSEPLLMSIFDHHSPGHDGAVVLDGMRIRRFAAHLPLSTRHEKLGAGGTRHAAALGIAERTDALTVVVSEERGVVSVARGGMLRPLGSPDRLALELREFLEATAEVDLPTWRPFGRWHEALGALAFAVALWAVLVPGSNVVEANRLAPVEVENVPKGYILVDVEPPEVNVTVEAPRRYLPESEELKVVIDADLAELGRRTFRVAPEQVVRPRRVTVLTVQPDRVRLSFEVDADENDTP